MKSVSIRGKGKNWFSLQYSSIASQQSSPALLKKQDIFIPSFGDLSLHFYSDFKNKEIWVKFDSVTAPFMTFLPLVFTASVSNPS